MCEIMDNPVVEGPSTGTGILGPTSRDLSPTFVEPSLRASGLYGRARYPSMGAEDLSMGVGNSGIDTEVLARP